MADTAIVGSEIPRSMPGLEVLHKNWGWFVGLGFLLVLLGLFALGHAYAATVATLEIYGWLLFFGGVALFLQSFALRDRNSFFVHLICGILSGIVGLMLALRPFHGAEAVTLVMAIYFLTGGLFRMFASAASNHPSWFGLFLSGMIDTILGIMILNRWPADSLWVIGMFVGVGMVFYGFSWITLGLAVRTVPVPASTPMAPPAN